MEGERFLDSKEEGIADCPPEERTAPDFIIERSR
jgi:hypothetical protein